MKLPKPKTSTRTFKVSALDIDPTFLEPPPDWTSYPLDTYADAITTYSHSSNWLNKIEQTINGQAIWKFTPSPTIEPTYFIEDDQGNLEPISREEVKTHELRDFLIK